MPARPYACTPAFVHVQPHYDFSNLRFVADKSLEVFFLNVIELTSINLEGSAFNLEGSAFNLEGSAFNLEGFAFADDYRPHAIHAHTSTCKYIGASLVLAHRCDQITDHSIDILSSSCPRITAINLAKCIKLTDLSLNYLGARCVACHQVLPEQTG